MGESVRTRRWWQGGWWLLVGLVLALDGCGGRLGTDPEEGGEGGEVGNEQSGGAEPWNTGGTGNTSGTGNSGGTGGSEINDAGTAGAGPAPVAGTGGIGGSTFNEAGTAGAAPAAGAAGINALLPTVSCDWVTALTKSCAISSCHGRLFQYGGLLLTPDDQIISRIKDKEVTLADVDCNPDPIDYQACTTPLPECQPYIGAKVVDSANPDASFILTKMRAMEQNGPARCGNQMPLAPGDSPEVGWNDERRFCIELFVRSVAALP
jgi:hypothetical protein